MSWRTSDSFSLPMERIRNLYVGRHHAASRPYKFGMMTP